MINKLFSKEEYLVTGIILSLIILVTLYNFYFALMRARDSTRRDDVGAISNALNQFYEDFGYFPPSEDGKIKYCRGENFDQIVEDLSDDDVFDRTKFFEGLRACEWGQDSFDDLLDEDYSPYIEKLPIDPRSEAGLEYLYISNTKRFQIYTHLEEESDAQGYDNGIVGRELDCGNATCNFGKSFAQTPLDISIDEYETILEQKNLEMQQ